MITLPASVSLGWCRRALYQQGDPHAVAGIERDQQPGYARLDGRLADSRIPGQRASSRVRPLSQFLTDRSSAGYALAFVLGGAAPRRRDITA
jgi:hypothetical protein